MNGDPHPTRDTGLDEPPGTPNVGRITAALRLFGCLSIAAATLAVFNVVVTAAEPDPVLLDDNAEEVTAAAVAVLCAVWAALLFAFAAMIDLLHGILWHAQRR